MSIVSDIILSWIIFLLVLWWSYRLHKSRRFYKSIPGPPTVPILGNALDFTSTTELLNTFSKYACDYGGIVKLQMGPFHKAILVTDYKFLECVLTNTKLLKKSEDYKFVRPWLGTGLLTGDEEFVDVFESCGRTLVHKLEQEVEKDSVDIHPYVTLCTLDIICESTMGISINAQNNGNPDYVRSVKDMCRIVIERSMSVLQRYGLFYILTKNYYTQRKALRILHAEANNGHDTTAAATSFTLFCLANHPDVQCWSEKLHR
ncbi:p450 domain containing protein [Asbolus verrucosus]|uniref:p450 domain containing protein n=1 Tax=Asbolus verrucosus TaxID=1661398 RepID=A0A482WEM3_ASBVE|nr:p450 domain containing protein [Asbolus verrucosus]